MPLELMDSMDEIQDTRLNSTNSRPDNGRKTNPWTYKPIIPPVYQTTTYETPEPGNAHYEYSRGTNPTRDVLQEALAKLESAKYCITFSSGLGSLTTSMFLIGTGKHVLCCSDVYGGTHRFFAKCAPQMGMDYTFVDGTNTKNWLDVFVLGKTKLVWIESPTNPTMMIIDIENIIKAVKKLDNECLVIVDNTFMTPIFQNPLKLGADIVMHSVTKYINGHSDVIMGCLMTNSVVLHDRLKFYQNALGIIPSPRDCSMVIRSVPTLEVRVKRQAESAMKIAKYLSAKPQVLKVMYPGLESHPQHDLAKKHYSGFGGMISFYLRGKSANESIKFVQAMEHFHIAVSLGCVHSLMEIPSLMTHAAVPEIDRDKLGITDNLLRLSIGLEDVDTLIEDLEVGFRAIDAVEAT